MKQVDLHEKPIDFQAGMQIQHQYLNDRIAGRIEDTLLVMQFNHIYTLGRVGKAENLKAEKNGTAGQSNPCDINSRVNNECRLIRTSRGGDITYHGPGQLVFYPVFNIEPIERDLHKYLRLLEGTMVQTLEQFKLRGYTIKGMTGVFSGRAGKEKIASIGIGVRRWITYHGISLNVNVDLDRFERINICGFENLRATSMEKLLNKKLQLPELINTFSTLLKQNWQGLCHNTNHLSSDQNTNIHQAEPQQYL